MGILRTKNCDNIICISDEEVELIKETLNAFCFKDFLNKEEFSYTDFMKIRANILKNIRDANSS